MLTIEEKQLKTLLQIWIFSFTLAMAAFLIAPNWVIGFLNGISYKISPASPLLPLSSEKFWLSLSGSLMVTLIFLMTAAASDISRKKDLVFHVLASKVASTLLFICYFFFHLKSPTYLLGALVDGSIFIITFIFYRRAVNAGVLRL